MEHALPHRQIVTTLVAEADRRGARLDDAGGFADIAAAGRGALPARAAAGAARDVGKGVGAVGPVGAPQALAARHAALALDMRVGQFVHEAARDARRPLAVDAAIGGMEDHREATGAGDRDIGQAAFLLE